MEHSGYRESFGGTAAENYQQYFVPAIGRPAAAGLVEAASLQPGEEVLDVACGTGVVTRLACVAVIPGGRATGLDVNPGMLAVARASTPADLPIEWVESPAEEMPLPAGKYDAVLCGIGLQFFADREAGLREMRRVLADGGRVALSLPGPVPPVFQVFERGLATHVGPEAAGFVAAVFDLHDADEIRDLLDRAGFRTTRIEAAERMLRLPAPEAFLWQYIHSTPLAAPVAHLDADRRAAFEREVFAGWSDHVDDGELTLRVRMTTVIAAE
ncbi:MAG: methyltransferase domain-containing protein [Gemmatimonadota bacterium]